MGPPGVPAAARRVPIPSPMPAAAGAAAEARGGPVAAVMEAEAEELGQALGLLGQLHQVPGNLLILLGGALRMQVRGRAATQKKQQK